jgi:hypothetical protein
VKGSLDAIWAEVRARERELLNTVSTGQPITEEMVERVVEAAKDMPKQVVNTIYDDLWKKVLEAKTKKVVRQKKVDERQLFLFQ